MFPEFRCFWEIQKKANFLQDMVLVQLCTSVNNCKGVRTFREAVLWKPFQLFRLILNDVSSITKAPSLQRWIQSSEQVDINWSKVRECCSVVTLFFAQRSWTKTDRCVGALSWSRNQLLVLHISGRFLLTASKRRRRRSLYFSLFTVAIPVNYASEFREFSEATRYFNRDSLSSA